MNHAARFPETLATGRLVLRRYLKGDAAGLLELTHANRSQLTRDFVQMSNILNLGDAQAFIFRKRGEWGRRSSCCYGIGLNGTQALIGQIQAKKIQWEVPSAELSYFIGSAWQRRGYARESIQSVLSMMFDVMRFQRISLRILPVNRPSLELARNLGFREEGSHRSKFRCGLGELHDVRHFALTMRDWDRAAQTLRNLSRAPTTFPRGRD